MKERLTGAIILVAAMVLLVPELLTGPVRTRSAPVTSAPAVVTHGAAAGQPGRAQPPLRSYTLTLGASAASSGSPSVAAAVTATRPVPPPASGTGTSQTEAPVQTGAPIPTRTAAAAPGLQGETPAAYPPGGEARSPASSTGWVVQLGSFASRPNADRLARSLEHRGFRMSVSPARAGARVLWRVRAGPAHDRAGAQRLDERLRALGHRGELLPVR